jgi:hypothetical protein
MRVLTLILATTLATSSQTNQRNYPHGHPPETKPGTPPCGYRGRNCGQVSPPPQHHDNHTARNVAIGVGVGALAGLLIASSVSAHESGPIKTLGAEGPQFAEVLHMSTFQVSGLVKGGWPLVVDYEAEAGTYAILTVASQNAAPFSQVLPIPETARRSVILQVPPSLGSDLKVADFTIRASVSPYDPRLRYFRIYGFGCGPRAVGSVAIDQLRFGPQVINSQQGDTQFSFHAHTTFDKVKAEFMQVALVDNCIEGKIFDDKRIDRRVLEDDSVFDRWNAKKAHQGQIQFRVRGWMAAEQGGDWVSAFSPDLVLKQ